MKKLNIFILLFVFIIGFQSCSCEKPEKTKVLINNGENIMLKRIGEEFDVKVSVENATEVIGLNAWITYDPAIVEVVDNDVSGSGTQVIVNDLGFLPNAQLLVSVQKDGGGIEQPGTLVCGYATIPPQPTSGDGDCFDVRFRAIAQGTTDINFSVLNLQDNDGDIPTDGIGDQVDVPVNATVRLTVQ